MWATIEPATLLGRENCARFLNQNWMIISAFWSAAIIVYIGILLFQTFNLWSLLLIIQSHLIFVFIGFIIIMIYAKYRHSLPNDDWRQWISFMIIWSILIYIMYNYPYDKMIMALSAFKCNQMPDHYIHRQEFHTFIAKTSKNLPFVVFTGNTGSGKTTLSHALCRNATFKYYQSMDDFDKALKYWHDSAYDYVFPIPFGLLFQIPVISTLYSYVPIVPIPAYGKLIRGAAQKLYILTSKQTYLIIDGISSRVNTTASSTIMRELEQFAGDTDYFRVIVFTTGRFTKDFALGSQNKLVKHVKIIDQCTYEEAFLYLEKSFQSYYNYSNDVINNIIYNLTGTNMVQMATLTKGFKVNPYSILSAWQLRQQNLYQSLRDLLFNYTLLLQKNYCLFNDRNNTKQFATWLNGREILDVNNCISIVEYQQALSGKRINVTCWMDILTYHRPIDYCNTIESI